MHTTAQVFVGALFGGVSGVAWHEFGQQVVRRRWFSAIEEWPLARMLYLRDSADVPNVFEYEYLQHRRLRGKQA